jgi:hypothetical protein
MKKILSRSLFLISLQPTLIPTINLKAEQDVIKEDKTFLA